jgi:hypothetical protein
MFLPQKQKRAAWRGRQKFETREAGRFQVCSEARKQVETGTASSVYESIFEAFKCCFCIWTKFGNAQAFGVNTNRSRRRRWWRRRRRRRRRRRASAEPCDD